MKIKSFVKTLVFTMFSCLYFFASSTKALSNKFLNETEDIAYKITMKQDILCLMMAYPEYITGLEQRDNGSVYIIMKSGKKIIYDDKAKKSFDGKLSNPDLQDMMEQPYPLNSIDKLMDKNCDPGRGRVYELMGEVYGNSNSGVQKNLTNVRTGYSNFQFNKNNKAAEELKAVMQELIPIAQSNQKVRAGLFPSSGTFNYRLISGTNRLSPHAFGTAIDLARDKRDYWKWASPEQGEKRLASYPKEIVEVFEKHNFVWGGKWNHFDILHFEYRPEIILKAKYFGNKSELRKIWYEGVPAENDLIKDYISKIEGTLS